MGHDTAAVRLLLWGCRALGYDSKSWLLLPALGCAGNICRSPTAEAMFQAVVQRNGVEDKFEIDSCGTGGGNPDW